MHYVNLSRGDSTRQLCSPAPAISHFTLKFVLQGTSPTRNQHHVKCTTASQSIKLPKSSKLPLSSQTPWINSQLFNSIQTIHTYLKDPPPPVQSFITTTVPEVLIKRDPCLPSLANLSTTRTTSICRLINSQLS